jgi:hypothetical protein
LQQKRGRIIQSKTGYQEPAILQIGIDSFAATISDPASGLTLSPVERMEHLLEEIKLARLGCVTESGERVWLTTSF